MTDWIVEPRPLLRHQGRLAEALPWATLAINVVGSFALATIAGLALRGTIDNGNLSLTLRVGLRVRG